MNYISQKIHTLFTIKLVGSQIELLMASELKIMLSGEKFV